MKQLRQYIRECFKNKILLEKRQGKEAEWDYLISEPFHARNHLACAWCNSAESILEVGSYKNPLYDFYSSGAAKVITVVDPKAETFTEVRDIGGQQVKIVSHGEKLHDVKVPRHEAVVALGLAIPKPKEGMNQSLESLKALCQLADTVILEGAVDWPEAVEQIELIMESLPHETIVDIQIDYSGSGIEDPDAPGKVYDDRRFVVLKK